MMKKTLCMLLSLVFVLLLFGGCGPVEGNPETSAPETTAPAPQILKVGFGRADITPKASVPLDGLGGNKMDRMSEDVIDPLYANCIAFTDDNNQTFLLIIADLLRVNTNLIFAKSKIAKETDVPYENIWVATTHNHSGPAMDEAFLAIEEYGNDLQNKVVQAAKDALADRKPAKTFIGETFPEKLNFVRHYVMDDGSICGDNFKGTGTKRVKHVSEADNQMQIIRFVREGGKDVVLANWQGHPTGHGDHRNSILSCVTVFTNKLEKELGCHAAYILGASGNINNSSRIPEEKITANYVEHYEKLAQHVIDVFSNLKEAEPGEVKVLTQEHTYTTNNDSESRSLSLSVASIGQIAFVAAPYEMFDESGKYIKDNAPFEMTFVSTCTNGYSTYIPTDATFEYGGYEVGLCRFARGTAELLAKDYVEMLKQIYN